MTSKQLLECGFCNFSDWVITVISDYWLAEPNSEYTEKRFKSFRMFATKIMNSTVEQQTESFTNNNPKVECVCLFSFAIIQTDLSSTRIPVEKTRKCLLHGRTVMWRYDMTQQKDLRLMHRRVRDALWHICSFFLFGTCSSSLTPVPHASDAKKTKSNRRIFCCHTVSCWSNIWDRNGFGVGVFRVLTRHWCASDLRYVPSVISNGWRIYCAFVRKCNGRLNDKTLSINAIWCEFCILHTCSLASSVSSQLSSVSHCICEHEHGPRITCTRYNVTIRHDSWELMSHRKIAFAFFIRGIVSSDLGPNRKKIDFHI